MGTAGQGWRKLATPRRDFNCAEAWRGRGEDQKESLFWAAVVMATGMGHPRNTGRVDDGDVCRISADVAAVVCRLFGLRGNRVSPFVR